jgi:hypothetical protein
MLSGKATNTNLIVFGLTRPGLEHTIYRTRGKDANHYAIDELKYSTNVVIGKLGKLVHEQTCSNDFHFI